MKICNGDGDEYAKDASRGGAARQRNERLVIGINVIALSK
jgi:hypothetical protein